MRAAWTAAEIRAAETGLMATVPDGELMRRASFGLAVVCERALGRVYGRRVAVLAGAGNNGGDALFAGAELARRGAAVTAWLLDPERAHGAALRELWAAGGRVGTGTSALGGADLVLDGIVGIGGSGGLRPAARSLVDSIPDGAVTVAVDLPSGVDADTGAVDGAAVRADVTVTFGGLKPGLLVGAGAQHAGRVHLIDIGLGPHLPAATVRVLEEPDVAALLPLPTAADDKYSRGVVGVSAGSAQYTGAAVLCVGAALHGGAGMVRYAGAAGDAIRARWPETIVHDELGSAGRVQAWAIGPGLGTDDDARAALTHVLGQDVPVIVDADGITLLAQHRALLERRTAPTVLTPHDREFERVFGEVGPDRIGAARRGAAEAGVTVLLKGEATVVAGLDGSVTVNPTGTPWLGTAGSGDVLSGLIGALLAGGLCAGDAASAGAYLHGVAGQLAAVDGPPTSVDVLAAVRRAVRTVRRAR